ncbi:MAG TPA: enoyl-CoA hydratase-related protein, partial [Paracoccaceae bacterium]|nr:enoyl-CoA hydratase-related protein [Paracoccaceae bacterium]
MGGPVRIMRHRGVGHLVMAGEPGNSLDHDMRRALMQGLDSLLSDKNILGIVIAGQGAEFSIGLPISDAATQGAAPTVSDIATRIEAASVPVVAALKGRALGAGLELALAAHRRVSTPTARFGMSQVKLGLVPGAGGTQRLPRLLGAETSLSMLLDWRTMPAFAARQTGLIDELANQSPEDAAEEMILKLRKDGTPLLATDRRREGFANGRSYFEAIKARRTALATSPLNAPKRIVDCIEAAITMPFEIGLAFEAEVLADCAAHPQSGALCHIAEAEAEASKRLFATGQDGRRAIDPDQTAKIALRLGRALEEAAKHLLSLGVTQERIDVALVDFGFAKGLFGGDASGPVGRDTEAIQRRIVAAMMAEGARLLSTRAVKSSGDVDVIAVHSLGFPRWKGGPMLAARQMGLLQLRKDMERWARESPIWAPPPLLTQAIRYAGGFAALDR